MSDGELKDFLVKSGFVSRAESQFLSEDEVRRATAHALGVPFRELSHEDISADALSYIPEPLSRKHNVVAFAQSEKGVEVALLAIEDLRAIESIVISKKILPRITSKESMTRALLVYQKHLKEKFGQDIAKALQSNSVDALTEALLRHALYSQARAIHAQEGPQGISIYYRIAHALHDAMMLPGRVAEQFFAKLAELHAKRTQVDGQSVKLRHHASAAAHGKKSVLHLVREGEGRHGFTLETLGFRAEAADRVERALAHGSGLVLVCGKEGAGKTTTLYTLLDQVSLPHLSLSSVEEKVEFIFPRVAQTIVDRSVGLTTAAALRATLKTDPDVVMVAEVADAQTAALAAQAANRGILVLAGVEAHSAVMGIEKMLALGVSPTLLSGALRASIGVSLVEKLGEATGKRRLTRAEETPLAERADFARVLASLKEEGIVERQAQWKDVEFAGGGVASGRLGLQEVLQNSLTIKELLRTGASAEEIEAQAREEGMLTLAEDALCKAAEGRASITEV